MYPSLSPLHFLGKSAQKSRVCSLSPPGSPSRRRRRSYRITPCSLRVHFVSAALPPPYRRLTAALPPPYRRLRRLIGFSEIRLTALSPTSSPTSWSCSGLAPCRPRSGLSKSQLRQQRLIIIPSPIIRLQFRILLRRHRRQHIRSFQPLKRRTWLGRKIQIIQ